MQPRGGIPQEARMPFARLSLILAPFLLSAVVAAQNVLLVIADDVGLPDLERVATPNIDALAAQGVTFSTALAMPVCQQSRRTIYFGEYWRRDSGNPCAPANLLAPSLALTSIAEQVAEGGATSVLIGKWHVGGWHTAGMCAPIEQGFQWWLAGTPGNLKSPDLLSPCLGDGHRDWVRAAGGPGYCAAFSEIVYTAMKQRDVALQALTVGGNKPRLIVFAPNIAHGPFQRPPAAMLPPEYPATATDEERYESMIVALDGIVGEMLDTIGDLDDWLVIFVGDNGTPQHFVPVPERGKDTCYERGVRVPMILAGGQVVKPDRTSSELVHVVDIYATTAAWMNTLARGLPPDLPSRSLLPTLLDQSHAPYHEYVAVGNERERAARSVDFKLIQRDTDLNGTFDVEEFYWMGEAPGPDGLPPEEFNAIHEGKLQGYVNAHRTWLEGALP
jgi:arylsulfatase A-like enzyme